MSRVTMALLLALTFTSTYARPLAGPVCLLPDRPANNTCIDPRFQSFWQRNGGLAVFGGPLGSPREEQTSEGTFLAQYFERNRLEYHPDLRPPYVILLGRLGVVRLAQQGRDWRAFPHGRPQTGCLWFQETQHSVCDQQNGAGFRQFWESHGLAQGASDPALGRYQRSLALFGLPLSEPAVETNAAGDTVWTQWFERARFEWHPDKPREFRVLLGLLGSEILPPPRPGPVPLPPAPLSADPAVRRAP